MDRVTLMPGECLPHDRSFAIALGSTHFDPASPEWLSKTHFIMLMRDEKLAQLQTRFDTESGVLGIAEDGRVLLRARLTEAEGCKRIAEFSENFLGGTVNGPLRVVAANYPVGIVNLSGRGMLVVSVARQLGSGDPFVRLLCCSAQAERGRERRPESVNLTMPIAANPGRLRTFFTPSSMADSVWGWSAVREVRPIASGGRESAPYLRDQAIVVNGFAQDRAERLVLGTGNIIGSEVDDLEVRPPHPRHARQCDAVHALGHDNVSNQ
jgi:hypothetical protein